MNSCYVKVATASPEIKVGDVEFNVKGIKNAIDTAEKKAVHVLAFPELSISGYTVGDLFYSKTMLQACTKALLEIAEYSKGKNMLIFVGLPFFYNGHIYNVSAGVSDGRVLGLVPKSYLPSYNEFNEKRYFIGADDSLSHVILDRENERGLVPFGRNIIFADSKISSFKVACELCDDLYSPVPPSIYHAVNGARIIVNLSCSEEFSEKPEQRRRLISGHSSKIVSAYVYANSGDGESTTDCVFSGHSLIAENGEILSENKPFANGLNVAEVDLDFLDFERSKVFNQDFGVGEKKYCYVGFSVDISNALVERLYDKAPFIKEGEEDFILSTQAQGLKKRIKHTNADKVVIGLSGGLDSTLALIVAVRAVKLLNRPVSDVLAVTMPCFGTSERTLDNSVKLAKAFGVSLKKIDITKTVKRHLKDLNHSETLHDTTYENAQARERTQVLMDVANMNNGLVVGTGDLSELALGWATYNGDHMSMYAVNASVPKTLVRHLVSYVAKTGKGKLKAVLLDILDTPVSPELLPPADNIINQVTEDIVGPYVLHDFFLYHFVKLGFTPKKIYQIAVRTFKAEFESATILKWLKVFIKRFFNQQFKRSCMPDGVKVSPLSLSPRGGWRMPSDAVSKIWLEELENL
ncbi:MAG: NAD(+) synthase [Clostridia bacterium]|nr:NAD(+) synthase [Clostridia bacterium]